MLKLNENKTEFMITISKRSRHLHSLPTAIAVGNAQIPLSVKNLGITLSCHLTMNENISNIAKTCYFELHCLASICRFLKNMATDTLAFSCFVLSRIDYCNSLLFESTHDVKSHLQRIQNYAAQIILHIPKSANITTQLKSLHWLIFKVRSTSKKLVCTTKLTTVLHHHMSLICFIKSNNTPSSSHTIHHLEKTCTQ